MSKASRLFVVIICFLTMLCVLSAAEAQQRLASQILDATGVEGGLIVHIGCGDGKLTVALRVNDSFLVHGLDADADNVGKARDHVKSLGLYGLDVTVDDARRIPAQVLA